MNAIPIPPQLVRTTFYGAAFRLALCGALLAMATGIATSARAESHSTLPSTVVHTTTKSVAVDSTYHWAYSVHTDSQVQISYVTNSAWQILLLVGKPVLANSVLGVDSAWHVLFYVGTDNRIWYWNWNGSAWVNAQLDANVAATDIVAIDSRNHFVWYRQASVLYLFYFNGSNWVSLYSGVNDCGNSVFGAVDETTHSLYWYDDSPNHTGLRCLASIGRGTTGFDVRGGSSANYANRPAIHQGTGEVFGSTNTNRIFWMIPGSFISTATLFSDNETFSNGGVAVNSSNGKLIYNHYNLNGPVKEIAVRTPTGSGASKTWPTISSVSGTTGHTVAACAIDQSYGWYFYTTTGDQLVHIVY